MTAVDSVVRTNTRMLVIENFGTCNMRCTYCFPEHMWQRQGHKGAMSEDAYRCILERAFSATTAETIDVHMAGGEPLLAGLPWFRRALSTAREIADQHGKTVTFSMQTNATLVTSEMAEFLVENGVTVGVSLDGDETINEEVRGHTDRTLAGFQRLRAALGRPPGVIVTVTRCNALRMAEVVAYLDSLDVAMFRANQMGATASWNAHSAPRAEEWATARKTIFAEIAARRGRMMEFNLAQTVTKLARTLQAGLSPFTAQPGCCAIRCPAGRELLYFDQNGDSYPCPRANVTPQARIAHYADPDVLERWGAAGRALDTAMQIPLTCAECPAQVVCDYGCHAFNVAQGNFFEVNCDATKDFFEYLRTQLDDAARVLFFVLWREQQKTLDNYEAVRQGVDVPPDVLADLTANLGDRLARQVQRPGLNLALLERRYGWREDLIPVAVIDRPRISARAKAQKEVVPKER